MKEDCAPNRAKYKVLICEQSEVVESDSEENAKLRVEEMVQDGQIELSYIAWKEGKE